MNFKHKIRTEITPVYFLRRVNTNEMIAWQAKMEEHCGEFKLLGLALVRKRFLVDDACTTSNTNSNSR